MWNPNSGVTIDKCAFMDCVELTDVELGGYSKIEIFVFHGCRHLRLKISGRTVVDNEFTGTTGLSYVEYSNELLSVGSHSFARCASLKGVNDAFCHDTWRVCLLRLWHTKECEIAIYPHHWSVGLQ